MMRQRCNAMLKIVATRHFCLVVVEKTSLMKQNTTEIKQLETPLMQWIKEKGIVSDRNQPLQWATVQRHTTQNLPKKEKK